MGFSYRHLSRQYAKVANLAYVLFQFNIPNCSNDTSGLVFVFLIFVLISEEYILVLIAFSIID
jgi:hypothetical protein